jgi:hypothetical protein
LEGADIRNLFLLNILAGDVCNRERQIHDVCETQVIAIHRETPSTAESTEIEREALFGSGLIVAQLRAHGLRRVNAINSLLT